MKLVEDRTLWRLLRLGVAACFIGHGAFGLLGKEGWLPYFGIFGIEAPFAEALMPLIGIVDISVGVLALVAPHRLLLGYAAFWCAWTALLRPLAGEPVWEALERAGNYGVPLAMLALLGAARWWRKPRAWTEWADPAAPGGAPRHAFTVLHWTTVVLLVGHGMLALGGKPLLVEHMAVVGGGSGSLRALGGLELALAAAVALRPAPALLLSVVAWKLATEALFPLAGAPVWEFVERGGSYVAPLAAAWLLLRSGVPALGTGRLPSLVVPSARVTQVLIPIAVLALSGLPADASPAPTSGPPRLAAPQDTLPGLGPALLEALRGGGFILACRHAATDYSRMDARSVDFGDPSTQRVLSEAGIEQARELGRHVARLRVPIGEVLASPFQRTFVSAELMFGTATVENALYGRGGPGRAALFTEPVPAGTNRALVTHQGVLYGLLRRPRGSIGEADCLVVRAGDETLTPLAQIRPGEWGAIETSTHLHTSSTHL